MKTLVVIPTYNEVENIQKLVPEVLRAVSNAEVLVVDDSSPDGTGAAVERMAQNDGRIHLLSRPGKQGLGRAYIAGLGWGVANGFEFLVEMDADFSHRPIDLKLIVETAQRNPGVDFVIGSRYVDRGATLNWGLGRKFISRGGSLYSRIVLGYGIRDWTGGFNGWRRHVLEKIELNSILSEGYSFQVEMKYRAAKCGFNWQEVPILFEDRRVGQSKMSGNIFVEAVWRVLKMRFS